MSKRIVVGIVSVLLLIGVFSLTFNIQLAHSEGHTITVPDDYPTIQAAINAANAGDTIYVRNGSYSGDGSYSYVNVNKSVALVGESRSSTVIYGVYIYYDTGHNPGYAIIVSADNVTITGFTISAGGGRDSQAPSVELRNVKGVNISGNNLGGPRYWYNLVVESSSNCIFSGNNIPSTSLGSAIELTSSSFNTFFGNNIGSVVLDASSINNWNSTYPTGGNYWSDTGIDLKKGPNQDQPGGDGIGDTPYVINANNTDYYPLMRPTYYFTMGIPFAYFNYTPNKLAGENVTFDASASLDLNGNIVNYFWDFGDGVTATSANPLATHAYGNVHWNMVKLTVTDNDGLTDTTTKDVSVGMVPTSISISTSSSSMFAGFKVDVAGTLRDMYGNGLKDKNIVLSYTFSGAGTWNPITSCTTDNAGNYLATWIPTATGSFTLKASWSGTDTVSAADSTTTLNCLSYNQYVFSVESNSTISGLAYNVTGQTLSFTATGTDGTSGYVRATVAKNLVANPAGIKVFLDGSQIACSPTSTSDSYLLYLTYQHSTHNFTIDLSATAEPTPTPTPTATPTPSPTPTQSPTPTPTPTSSPTSQPTSNPTSTPQPEDNSLTNWMLILIPVAIAIIIIALAVALRRKKLHKPQTA